MQLFISLVEWVVVLPFCVIWVLSSSSFTFFNVNANGVVSSEAMVSVCVCPFMVMVVCSVVVPLFWA